MAGSLMGIAERTIMKYVFIYLLGVAVLTSCGQSSSTQDNPGEETAEQAETTTNDGVEQQSTDWAGTYEGVLPCADCPGIKTTVVLNNNDTFRLTQDYEDRDLKVDDNGKIMWHDGGKVAHLRGTDVNLQYEIGDDQLKQLGEDGKEVTSSLAEHYVLKRIKDAELPVE